MLRKRGTGDGKTMEQLKVKLEVFEGPLELLLHLIEKNKVDIYDIPIVEITEQYLAYVRAMETEDMNIMSDFLVMAATLLDIKCKMLLPKQEDEEGEEEDPRTELVEQLLQYKLYKYMSYELKDRQMDAQQTLYKHTTLPKEVEEYRPPIDYEELLGDMTLPRLYTVFESIIRRQEDRIDPIRNHFGKIEKDEVNLEEKQRYIESYLYEHGKADFKMLLEQGSSRMEVIVTFLVILELMKLGKIMVSQENTFDAIYISWQPDAELSAAPMEMTAVV